MKKRRMIVFEGPDMSGKTTQANEVCEYFKNNKIEGKEYKIKYIKFPLVDGFKGFEIYDHLSKFNFSENNLYKTLFEIVENETNLYLNKLQALDYMIKEANKVDIIIVDRFDMSQLCYAFAWCLMLENACNKKKFMTKKSKENFLELVDMLKHKIINMTNEIHSMYSEKFDIGYVKFEKSKCIENIVKNNNCNDRRFDKYDSNNEYQNYVSNLFNLYGFKCNNSKDKDMLYEELIADMASSYIMTINMDDYCEHSEIKFDINELINCIVSYYSLKGVL